MNTELCLFCVSCAFLRLAFFSAAHADLFSAAASAAGAYSPGNSSDWNSPTPSGVTEALDRLGIAGNTLVVFSTDHGHFLGQHGLTAKGAFHYEDMLRVPFIVRQPGSVPAGRVSNSLQALIDLPETFLSVAGIQVPGLMQGVNQLPVWQGRELSARAEVIVENRHQPTTLHLRTYIAERYKLTVYRDRSYGEFFDLQDDPGELRNRWDDHAYASRKAEVMHRFLNAEVRREPTRLARIAGA